MTDTCYVTFILQRQVWSKSLHMFDHIDEVEIPTVDIRIKYCLYSKIIRPHTDKIKAQTKTKTKKKICKYCSHFLCPYLLYEQRVQFFLDNKCLDAAATLSGARQANLKKKGNFESILLQIPKSIPFFRLFHSEYVQLWYFKTLAEIIKYLQYAKPTRYFSLQYIHVLSNFDDTHFHQRWRATWNWHFGPFSKVCKVYVCLSLGWYICFLSHRKNILVTRYANESAILERARVACGRLHVNRETVALLDKSTIFTFLSRFKWFAICVTYKILFPVIWIVRRCPSRGHVDVRMSMDVKLQHVV